jgi:crossover junction endodeoxyribonuclease RuvC
MPVAGIDPGIHGALAVVDEDGECNTVCMPVMGSPKAIVDGGAVVRWLGDNGACLAMVEAAQAFPGQGVSTSFRFGQAYGQILGALQAALIPYRIVTPARWKGDLRLSRDKEQSRRRAIELLPRAALQFALKKDEARAEAALIAWWYLHGRTPHEQHGKVLRKHHA